MSPAVIADSVLHRLIFLHGRFGKLQAEFEGFRNVTVSVTVGVFDKLSNFFLSEGLHLYALSREPLLHLSHAVRVVKVRDILHG